MLGLLLYGEAVAFIIELCHAVSLGVVHPVAEDCRLAIFIDIKDTLPQDILKPDSMEYVVAKHQADAVITDKLLSDNKGLGKTIRGRLLSIAESDPYLMAVTK